MKIQTEVLGILRNYRKEMNVQSILERTDLTEPQVRKAIAHLLNRGLVKTIKEPPKYIGQGVPPIWKTKYIIVKARIDKIDQVVAGAKYER